MARRSRGGCIDCKRAKVKCDEFRPTCGTCARRGYNCQGYWDAKVPSRNLQIEPISNQQRRRRRSGVSVTKKLFEPQASPTCSSGSITRPILDSPLSPASYDNNLAEPSYQGSTTISISTRKSFELIQIPSLLFLSNIPILPPGTIRPADEPTIEVYFTRHPDELVIGPEFVDEMNANVLMVLQQDPKVIIDSLFAIGQIYMGKSQCSLMVPALDRRAQILARLRAMNGLEPNLEQIVVILLGLCAMELLDTRLKPQESSIRTLIANSAILINHHVRAGVEVTSLGKYFIRALARQDMILSLTHFHRPLIPTAVWLDEGCGQSADRLMGYTTTLMPLLTELCGIAEEIRGVLGTKEIMHIENPLKSNADSSSEYNSLSLRAADLRAQIDSWRPISPQGVPFRCSKKLLSHSYATRSAALLYLHRLFHPPGSSPGADQMALTMAHEVLVHTSGPPDELRLLLWPIFIAASELENGDERLTAVQMFDAICKGRNTATALRTKNFCIERVWEARNAGFEWNWMAMVDQYPGECVPI